MIVKMLMSATFVLLVLLDAENASAHSINNQSPSPSWTDLTSPNSQISVTWINGNSTGSSLITYSPSAANIWSYDGNISNQSSANILKVIDTQFGLGSKALTAVSQCNIGCSSTYTSTKSFDYLAVHYGNGELLFDFSKPITSFTISGLHNGLSNYRAYNNISPVSEPTEGALLLSGIGLLGFIAIRRKSV
jgi:hypothetical protein